MSKNKKEIPYWAKTGHAKPVTRRDFLSAGLVPFAANIFVPNWISLILGNPAHAQTSAASCNSVGASMIPFVTVNLSGGASLASNFVPMDAGGQMLASYSKMGLGDNQVPIVREFGNAPFAGDLGGGVLISKFLTGLRQQASAATIGGTAFVGIPCNSQNDTDSNKFDISGAITKAGLVGTNLPNLGRVNTRTGIKQSSSMVNPPSPLVVNSYSALLTSIGYSANLGAALNVNQKNSLAKLISNLSGSQSAKLNSVKGAAGVKKVLDCAGIKNVDVVQKGASIVDPRGNAGIATAWGINANTNAGTREMILGAMVYNTLLGQAGTSNIDLGGYDYHSNNRTDGNAKDLDAGVVVGRILESARVLNKPLMIYVTSDGSVSSTDSATNRQSAWTGDNSAMGMAYMIYYNPAGRPEMTGNQIGQFTNNQGADTKFITGGSAELTGAAVFANWCAANKRMDLFDVVSNRVFNSGQLASVLKIA